MGPAKARQDRLRGPLRRRHRRHDPGQRHPARAQAPRVPRHHDDHPRGQELLREDPNVDDWVIQGQRPVPNHLLPEYWAVWERKYDRFINLCESVEGTLLPIPGRSAHKWPDNLRRSMLNQNYGEFVARIADLPYESAAGSIRHPPRRPRPIGTCTT